MAGVEGGTSTGKRVPEGKHFAWRDCWLSQVNPPLRVAGLRGCRRECDKDAMGRPRDCANMLHFPSKDKDMVRGESCKKIWPKVASRLKDCTLPDSICYSPKCIPWRNTVLTDTDTFCYFLKESKHVWLRANAFLFSESQWIMHGFMGQSSEVLDQSCRLIEC